MINDSKTLATVHEPNSELAVAPEKVPVVNRDNPFDESKYMASISVLAVPATIASCILQVGAPGADFLGFGALPILTALGIATVVTIGHPDHAVWSLQRRVKETLGFMPPRNTIKALRKLQRSAHQSKNTIYTRENSEGLESFFDAIDKPEARTELIVRKHAVEVLYQPKESSISAWDKALNSTIEVFRITPKRKHNQQELTA